MKSFGNFPALILLSLSIHPQPYLKHILAIQPCFVMSYQNEQNNEYEKEVGMLFRNEQLPKACAGRWRQCSLLAVVAKDP